MGKLIQIFPTTNHSIRGAVNNPSFEDRIFYIVFSEYYNKDHKPIHDFGSRFFDDWEFDQWNLFYNLAACCLQVYLEHGLIEAPGSLHVQKQQRGEIGEDFFYWADNYFIHSGDERFDFDLNKKEVYDSYTSSHKSPKFLYKPRPFWNIFRMWCSYHGFTCIGLTHSDRIQKGTGSGRQDFIQLKRVNNQDIKIEKQIEQLQNSIDDDIPF